jgi:hypothetical protein
LIRPLLSEIAETTWRDWLAVLAEFAGVCVIVASIALIAIGFSPEAAP